MLEVPMQPIEAHLCFFLIEHVSMHALPCMLSEHCSPHSYLLISRERSSYHLNQTSSWQHMFSNLTKMLFEKHPRLFVNVEPGLVL